MSKELRELLAKLEGKRKKYALLWEKIKLAEAGTNDGRSAITSEKIDFTTLIR